MADKIRNITGNPVSGSDFHGRVAELKILRRTIENGNHVLILAPRRVGKSSVVAETERQLKADGWKVVSVDVQHAEDEAGFLQLIYEAIHESEVQLEKSVGETIKSGIGSFRTMLRGFKGGALGVQLEVSEQEASWQEAATPLRLQIKRLAKPQSKILFAMDELPIFLSSLVLRPNGIERVQRILNWLRSVRQACGSDLPWVLCGSIGLDTFVQNHGLEGVINDLTEIPVGAFSTEDATTLLQRLAEAEPTLKTLPSEVIAKILERVGWLLPYYLQLMFHSLVSIPDDKRTKQFPSVSDIDTAYQVASRTKHLGHWSSRLKELLSPDERRRSQLLLNHISLSTQGSTREQLFGILQADSPQSSADELQSHLRRLLKHLADDGYIAEENETIRFRSFLLRDFWKQEYGK